MSDAFDYDGGGNVYVTTPSGKKMAIASTDGDLYWADAIAFALNFLREHE